MGKISVTVEEAVEVLNRLLKKDPGAMSMLVHARVLCNEELANDETAQVGRKSPGIYRIGLQNFLIFLPYYLVQLSILSISLRPLQSTP